MLDLDRKEKECLERIRKKEQVRVVWLSVCLVPCVLHQRVLIVAVVLPPPLLLSTRPVRGCRMQNKRCTNHGSVFWRQWRGHPRLKQMSNEKRP